jgi:hypothetical protein
MAAIQINNKGREGRELKTRELLVDEIALDQTSGKLLK